MSEETGNEEILGHELVWAENNELHEDMVVIENVSFI